MRKVLILLLLPAFCSSQKIEQDYIDKFDASRTVQTTKEIVAKTSGITQLEIRYTLMQFKEDSIQRYAINIWATAGYVMSLSKRQSAFLKLSNAETIKLQYLGDYHSVITGDRFCFYASISKSDIEKLASTKVTDIRLETSGSSDDYIITDKFQDKLVGLSQAILAVK
jgi:hypothetical protein